MNVEQFFYVLHYVSCNYFQTIAISSFSKSMRFQVRAFEGHVGRMSCHRGIANLSSREFRRRGIWSKYLRHVITWHSENGKHYICKIFRPCIYLRKFIESFVKNTKPTARHYSIHNLWACLICARWRHTDIQPPF